MNTRGKGPFARRAHPAVSVPRQPHWAAPRLELTPDLLDALRNWLTRHADAGVQKMFDTLAGTRPEFRLARNLSEQLRRMATADIADALGEGLSTIEDAALFQLEGAGIPIELLSVAHGLLNLRERQELITQFGDAMLVARNSSG